MKVDISQANKYFKDLIDDPSQIVFLDANFFIPPDRSGYVGINCYRWRFDKFREIWLEPLFSEFIGMSIHESVYSEIVGENEKEFVDECKNSDPIRLRIYHDSELNEIEIAQMNTYIYKLAVHSQYDPDKNNAKDRGEVLSLSYMAVKKYLYFAANDKLPIRLIKSADKMNTGLDDMGVIQMYELIYYLNRIGKYDNKALKGLYKYQYYLTDREKKQNPNWEMFLQKMNELYGEILENANIVDVQ